MQDTPNSAPVFPTVCRSRMSPRKVCWAILLVVLVGASGCQKTVPEEKAKSKPPRPVSVMRLSRTKQIKRQLITGSIAPWKTEQIGFEVSGRVSFVIEKNDEVQPVLPSDLALRPTPLARVEPERLEIALETAKADKQVAEGNLEANRVAIEKRIPAAIKSATSDLEFAESELERADNAKTAISQSELDGIKNRFSVAQSALASAKAELAQAQAQQATLAAQVLRANQSIEEARRNLRNTTLYSSFRGIVSEVHSVPGSYVQPGDPVATVQMMDPMLVQFEVSPKDSRNYAKGDILEVIIPNITGLLPETAGRPPKTTGMVYTVDAVADPNSRTYTVTLHIRNQKASVPLSKSKSTVPKNIARTQRVFPLNVASIITGGKQQLIEQSCVHQIGNDKVVWKITNRQVDQPSDPGDRVLMVEPVKVTVGTEAVTLLGQWKFVPVEFENNDAINTEKDLVTGKLIYPVKEMVSSENAEVSDDLDSDPWAPRAVVLEQQRWMLRSGDVVQVVKSGTSLRQGYFVPMKAVLDDNGKTFVHIGERDDQGQTFAKRIEVDVQNQTSLSEDSVLVEVMPVVQGALSDGMLLVIGGSHYLSDGARVKVVKGESR